MEGAGLLVCSPSQEEQLNVSACCVACCSVKLFVFSIMHGQSTGEIWMNPGVKCSSISILELLRCGLCGLVKDTLSGFFSQGNASVRNRLRWIFDAYSGGIDLVKWVDLPLNLSGKSSCVKTKYGKYVTENAIVFERHER